jgi:hypothetical protein
MIKKRLIAAAVLILCLSPWTACASAGGSADLLNELDGYLKEDKKAADPAAKEGLFGQLADHFSASLELRSAHYLKPVPDLSNRYVNVDKDVKVDDARLTGRMRANWASWMGKEGWSAHAAGWFQAGTEADTYGGVTDFMTDRANEARYAELNELFVNLSPGGDTTWTLGKKVFKNGIATIYSPANRYTSADLHDPVNPVQLGTWQMTGDHSSGDTVYTAALLPFYQEKKIPPVGSRWLISELPSGYSLPSQSIFRPGSLREVLQMLFYFWTNLLRNGRFSSLVSRGATFSVREDLPGNSPGDWGWFGRVKKPMGNWDTFLSAYYGPSFYPVLRLEVSGNSATLIKETPTVQQVAGGFSTTWGSTEFHGEALYSYSRDGHDDSYINYVAGLCHSPEGLAAGLGLKKLDLVLEYAGEMITAEQGLTDFILSSKYTRLGRNDLIATAIAAVTDDLSLHYLADFNLTDKAHFQRIGASLRVVPGVVVSVDFEFFKGSLESYFGRWSNNDRVVTALKWTF